MEKLLNDLSPFQSGKMLAFVNGSGGTSRMELHIIYRRVKEALSEAGIELAGGVVDSLFTTLEMGGFSLSLFALDDELLDWWKTRAAAPYFRWPA